LRIGPDLTDRYQVSVSSDLKPFYFYSVRNWSSLRDYLNSELKSEEHLQSILIQLFRAIYNLHRCCIIHTNICLKNILYDAEKKVLRLDGFENSKVLRHCYPFKTVAATAE